MVYRLVVSPEQLSNGRIQLTTDQLHYLKRVLRFQDGDRFVAMDGSGQSWLAQGASVKCSLNFEAARQVRLKLSPIAYKGRQQMSAFFWLIYQRNQTLLVQLAQMQALP